MLVFGGSCFDDLKSENGLELIEGVGDDGEAELAVEGLVAIAIGLGVVFGLYWVTMRSRWGGVSGVAPWPRLE